MLQAFHTGTTWFYLLFDTSQHSLSLCSFCLALSAAASLIVKHSLILLQLGVGQQNSILHIFVTRPVSFEKVVLWKSSKQASGFLLLLFK